MKKHVITACIFFCITPIAFVFSQNAEGDDIPDKPAFFVAAEVTASSFIVENEGAYFRYHPWMAFDDDPLTSWNEGAEGAGIDERLEAVFSRPVLIDKLEILSGYYDPEWYIHNNRIRTCTIYLDDEMVDAAFNDRMTVKTVSLPRPLAVSRIRLIITGVYQGITYDDTCVSEIRFFYQGERIKLDNEAVLEKIRSHKGRSPFFSPAGFYCDMRGMYGWCKDFFFQDGGFVRIVDEGDVSRLTVRKGTWKMSGSDKILVTITTIIEACGTGCSLSLPLGRKIFEDAEYREREVHESLIIDWSEDVRNTSIDLPGAHYRIRLITAYHINQRDEGYHAMVDDYIQEMKEAYLKAKERRERGEAW